MANVFDQVVDEIGTQQPQVTPVTTQPVNPAGDTTSPLMATTVPAEPPVDPEREARKETISANMHDVIETSADQNAADIKLANQQGVPVDTAARQRALLGRRQKVSEIDFGALLDESPELGKQLEDKYFAGASHDDLQNLGTLERWSRTAVSGFKQGREQNEVNRLQFAKAFSPVDTPSINATIKAMKAKAANQQQADGFAGWIQSAATIAGQLESNFEAGAAGAAGGAAAGGVIGAAATAPAGGVGAVPGAIAGGAAGFGRGFFADLLVTSMGSSFDSMEQIEQEQGQPLNTGAKYSIATGVGLVNAYLERLSLGLLGKPLEEVTKKLITRKAAEKLSETSFRAAATKFGKAYGGAVLGETAQEGVQSVLQSLGNEVAAQLSYSDYQGLLQDPKKMDAALDNAFTSMEMAFKGTALIGLPGPGFNFAHDSYTARKSEHNQQALRAIADSSANSKLAERLPEQYQQFVKRVQERAGPAGLENVYIPAKEFATYFQSQGESDVQIANQLGLGDQYDTALASGGDLVVPLETVATKLARSEHYAGLEPFIRVAPDDMSLAELKAFNPEHERAKQDIADAQATLANADKTTASDRVFSQVYGQLLNTSGNSEVARNQASLVGGIYDALASRSSVADPEALMAKFGLRVENTLPDAVKRRVDVVRRAKPIDRAQQIEMMAEVSPGARQYVIDAAALKDALAAPAPTVNLNNSRAVTRAIGKKAVTLSARIGQLGGLKTDGYEGEFKTILDGQKGAKLRIIRKNGVSADEMARMLEAEGYLTANPGETMAGPEQLFAALELENSGSKVYPTDVQEAITALEGDKQGQLDFERYVDELQINADSTVAQIAEAMAKHAEETRQQVEESGRAAVTPGSDLPSIGDQRDDIFFQSAAPGGGEKFKEWFGDSKAVDANGNPLRVYHGSQRSDRISEAGKFDKARATSGPMAFFSDSPEIASNYANGKKDTSLEVENLSDFFTINGVKGDLDKAWASLSATERVRIRKEAWKVGVDEETDAIGLTENGLSGERHFTSVLNDKRGGNGNPLRALYQNWVEGGQLYNEEEKFTEVLNALGIKSEYDNPYAIRSGVFPVYLSIKKPLDTKAISDDVVTALEKASETAPEAAPEGMGADQWDKRNQDPKVWIKTLKDDIAKGDNSFVWTSIPDWVTDTLKGLGYDGIKDVGGKMGNGEEHSVWVPFDEGQIKSVFNKGTFDPNDPNILNQDAKNGKADLPGTREPRGSIQFMDNPDVKEAMQAVIRLGPKADLSTFLHETGHLGLEMMRYLVKTGAADEGLKADLDTLVEWFGVKDANAIGREQHEQFAKGFEVYLREGTAPSLRLHDAFNRFRAWLTRIYASVTGMGVQLSPEVREVMDRLVATDAEIEQARSLDRFAADPEVMKLMTDAEKADYQKHIQRAVDYAHEQVMKMSLREAFERQGKPYLEEQERVRAEVEAEVNKQPVYKAIEFLGSGKWIDGEMPEGVTFDKLNRASLVDEFGEGILKALPRTFGYLYKTEGGMSADEAASLFGFANGQEMVQSMVRAAPRKQVIEERTTGIMQQRHGDVMRDGSIEREALESLHNDHRARAIAAELRALSKSAKTEPSVNAYSRQVAKDFVARQKFMNVSNFNRFYRAEVAAAKDAQEAILSGDKDLAVKAKQRQLLNHYLFMEARAATQEVEKNVRHFKKLLKNGRKARRIDPDYLDQIETLLGRFDFTRLSAPQIEKRKSLADFITEQQANDVLITIPEKIRDEAFRKNYRDMPVDDIRGLFDAVTNLEHHGRLERGFKVAGQEVTYQVMKDNVLNAIAGNGMKVTRGTTQNPTKADKLISGAKSLEASLLRVEDFTVSLGGGKDLNPVHNAIYGVLADANANRFRLMVDVSDKVAKVINGATSEQRKRWNQWHTVKSIGRTFKGTDILAMALNMGNQGNIDRLLKGENWTMEQVNDATSILTKEDWNSVQAIWDVLESLQPQLAEVMKEQTGLKFGKVEPKAVQTPHGLYRGGYYPIVYDKTHSYDAWVSEQQSVVREDGTGALFEKSPILPEVSRGFTEARGARGLEAPLFLSLDVLPAHLDKVIHYITMAGPVKQVDRLLRDKEVAKAIIGSVGMEQFRILRPWLSAVARGNANDEKVSGWQYLAKHIRVGTTTAVLAFKVASGIRQFEGLSVVAGKVGVGNTLYGVKQVLNPTQWRYAFDTSKILQHRAENFDRDIGVVMRSLNRAGTVKQMVGKFGMSFIAYSQLVVDTATWHAGHQKWLKENPMDEDGAVRYADSVIRQTQGSGETLDLIEFQRSNEFQKLFSTFYTPFAVMHNMIRQSSRGGMSAKTVMQLTHAIFWTVSVPAIMDVMIDAALKGQGDDDDDDSLLQKIALKHMTTIGGSIPYFRDIMNVATEGRSGNTALGNFATQSGLLLRDMATFGWDEKTLKRAAYSASVLTHIPVYNPYKSAEHLVNSASGESDFNIGDFLQGERGR